MASQSDSFDVLDALGNIAKAASGGSSDIATVLSAAGLIITASSKLIKQAQPMLEGIDTDAMVGKAKATFAAAGENVGKAADTVSGAFSKLGDAKDGILESLASAKSEKELRQAVKEARQAVLENATSTITIANLLKAQEKSGQSGIGPVSDMPGCFVLATYKKIDFDKDLTDYIGIFVGKAENVAEGLSLAISRDGNPDIYADVKYKQNVHAYIYPCMPDQLEERYNILLASFVGEGSYN